MSRLFWAGLGVAGLGIAATLAWKRREVAVAVTTTAQEARTVVRKAAEKIVKTTLSNEVLKNFATYNIPALIEQTRKDPKTGAEVPWSLAAAMVALESGGHPHIYNYYEGDKIGKSPKHVGYWTPGTPLPDGQAGRPHAWAAGLVQIIRKYPRGLTLEQRFDARRSLEVIMPEWRTFYARASAAGLSGPALWAAVYFAHNKGAGAQQKGLAHASGGMAAIAQNAGLDAATSAAALAVSLGVAARVPLWAAVEQSLKGNPA